MDSGAELATDLQKLWLCATQDIPEIASRWSGANQELAAHSADQGAFNRQTSFNAGGHDVSMTSVGRVYPYFDALRDDIQNIMAESTTNAYDAADALITIANNYAANDTEAGNELKRIQSDFNANKLPRPNVTKAQ